MLLHFFCLVFLLCLGPRSLFVIFLHKRLKAIKRKGNERAHGVSQISPSSPLSVLLQKNNLKFPMKKVCLINGENSEITIEDKVVAILETWCGDRN
jgi:hypothetical protein